MMTLFKLCVIQPDAVRSLRLDSLMVEVKSYVQPIKYNQCVAKILSLSQLCLRADFEFCDEISSQFALLTSVMVRC